MSETKLTDVDHSPTPWRVDDEGEVVAADETCVGLVHDCWPCSGTTAAEDAADGAANARRIVAAVNATAKLSIGWLEAIDPDVLDEFVHTARQE